MLQKIFRCIYACIMHPCHSQWLDIFVVSFTVNFPQYLVWYIVIIRTFSTSVPVTLSATHDTEDQMGCMTYNFPSRHCLNGTRLLNADVYTSFSHVHRHRRLLIESLNLDGMPVGTCRPVRLLGQAFKIILSSLGARHSYPEPSLSQSDHFLLKNLKSCPEYHFGGWRQTGQLRISSTAGRSQPVLVLILSDNEERSISCIG